MPIGAGAWSEEASTFTMIPYLVFRSCTYAGLVAPGPTVGTLSGARNNAGQNAGQAGQVAVQGAVCSWQLPTWSDLLEEKHRNSWTNRDERL